MKVLSYSSSEVACGINDYNRHLTRALGVVTECDTVGFPHKRASRDQFRALLALRREFTQLAARADHYDVALLQWHIRFWNGARPVENMLPLFMKRMRRPMIMVLHEWPPVPGLGGYEGRLPARMAKRALTAAWLARDVGQLDYAAWMERDVFQRMDHIIVHAPELRDRLVAAGVTPARISMTPFPLHELPTPTWSADEVVEKFGLRGRRPLLLLGHPVPRKGFDVAVRALAQLPRDVVIVLVCSQAEAFAREAVEELQRVAIESGVRDRLIISDFLDDAQLASMFQVVNLALSPFRSVTGSSSLAHFLAAGLPVVASDLPAIRLTAEQGAGVALAAPDSANDLAAKIAELLDHPTALADLRAANRAYAGTMTFPALARALQTLAASVAA